MEVSFRPNELMIYPETDFERKVLSYFRDSTAFLKCGLTPAEVVGYVIRITKPKSDPKPIPDHEYRCPHCLSDKVYMLLNVDEKEYLCGDCTKSWKG